MSHAASRPAIAWNPGGAERILIAAGADQLDEVEELLATLPLCTRGQVFIEAERDLEITRLIAPGRVSVHWLSRERRLGTAKGEMLDRAVEAWLGEMLAGTDKDPSIYAWIAREGAARLLQTR
jgi:NADPH-dependent ferric siderophore reductase